MDVEIYNKGPGEWNEYVGTHPAANIYHLYEWGVFFEEFYNFKPFYLAVNDGDSIVGVVPLVLMKNYAMKNVLVSLPFFCIGGILSSHPDVEGLLLEKIKKILADNKCDHVLLRSEHVEDISKFGHISKVKSTFVLPLDVDSEKVFSGFQKQIRRRIRKGYKFGCKIDISPKYFDDFFDIYRKNMRLLGSPAHKSSFYSEVLKRFPENYNVLVVLYEGEVIGAQLLSYFKETVYLPLASSLREYNRYSPNQLLYWESIKYGCENGYKFCDFGRSTVGSGSYLFKKQWNALEVPLYYCYCNTKNHRVCVDGELNKKLELVSNLWKQTPLAVTNVLGPFLSKFLP